MFLVRVELPAGKAADYRVVVGEATQKSMQAALKVPLEEQSRILTEHEPGELVISSK